MSQGVPSETELQLMIFDVLDGCSYGNSMNKICWDRMQEPGIFAAYYCDLSSFNILHSRKIELP